MAGWAVPLIATHGVLLSLVANLHAWVEAVTDLKMTCATMWRGWRTSFGEFAIHLLLHLGTVICLLREALTARELLAWHGAELRVVEFAVGEW